MKWDNSIKSIQSIHSQKETQEFFYRMNLNNVNYWDKWDERSIITVYT